MSGTTTSERPRAGQRNKTIEDVIAYATGHRIRVELLVLLNQGTYSASELADLIGQPANKTSHHLTELADGGAIEVAKAEMDRNFERHYYKANLPHHYSKEEWAKLNDVERQMIAGFLLQSLVAESFGAFRAKKFATDLEMVLLWDHVAVDKEGRRKIMEAQERHFEHLEELENEAKERADLAGEKTVSYMVASMSFERSVDAPPAAHASADAD